MTDKSINYRFRIVGPSGVLPALRKHCACILLSATLVFFAGPAAAGKFADNMAHYSAAKTYAEQLRYLDAALEGWTYGDGQLGKADAHLRRGNIRYTLKQAGGAVADFTAALELAPDQVGICLNRGNAYKLSGDYKAATSDYSKLLKHDQFRAMGLTGMGDVFLLTKNFAKAEEYYEAARRANPSEHTPVFNMAVLYYLQGKYEKAKTLARKASDMDVSGNFRFYALVISGYSNFCLDRHKSALRDFNASLKLKPDYLYAVIGAGLAHSVMAETEKASARLRQAEKLDPRLKDGVKTLELDFKAQEFRFLNDKVRKEFDTMSLLLHYGK